MSCRTTTESLNHTHLIILQHRPPFGFTVLPPSTPFHQKALNMAQNVLDSDQGGARSNQKGASPNLQGPQITQKLRSAPSID